MIVLAGVVIAFQEHRVARRSSDGALANDALGRLAADGEPSPGKPKHFF